MRILLFCTLCFFQIFCEQVCPGIVYERIHEPESIHLLRIDPHLIEVRPVHAWNLGFGRESLFPYPSASMLLQRLMPVFFD